MNEFDQFIKHKVKAKYYIRYADDFVVLLQYKEYLKEILVKMRDFLQNELKLDLHPNKVSVETFSSGVNYLGWVHFPTHRVLRSVTKRRMFKRIIETILNKSGEEGNPKLRSGEKKKQNSLIWAY